MATKNKKDNDLILANVWLFSFVLTIASLFGVVALSGIASSSSLLVLGLVLCSVVGVFLFIPTSLHFWLEFLDDITNINTKKRLVKRTIQTKIEEL